MNNSKSKFSKFLGDNKVALLFVVLCIGGIIASKQPLSFVGAELFTRIGRNSFLVLALIIPVLAGMGLNFGIVIGAMAAQIAVFCVSYWGILGIQGFMVCVLITTPIAALFGYLVGLLFNRMKGSEMIGGMILAYFADGLYQLLFLFIIGGVIPVNNSRLIISSGIGVKNTIDLKDTIKYALDAQPLLPIVEVTVFVILAVCAVLLIYRGLIKKQDVNYKGYFAIMGISAAVYAATYIPAVYAFLSMSQMSLLNATEFCVALVVIIGICRIALQCFTQKNQKKIKRTIAAIVAAGIIYALTYIPYVFDLLSSIRIPAVTYLLIGVLCVFNMVIMKTRLGQNMRAVGQNMTVANAAGINVDRTRIIAMIISTMLAGYGQLILLQNIGTFQTYGAHTQIGLFAIAALLVGGASVHMATNKQAIVGVILFHTLFIVAPIAGKELFGNAQIGEYFRVFVAYGVIAVSLAMHAWKTIAKPKITTPMPPPNSQAAKE